MEQMHQAAGRPHTPASSAKQPLDNVNPDSAGLGSAGLDIDNAGLGSAGPHIDDHQEVRNSRLRPRIVAKFYVSQNT